MQEQNLEHDYNEKLQSYCQELESGSRRPHDIELANFLREVRDLVLEQTKKVNATHGKRKLVCGV